MPTAANSKDAAQRIATMDAGMASLRGCADATLPHWQTGVLAALEGMFGLALCLAPLAPLAAPPLRPPLSHVEESEQEPRGQRGGR